MVGASQVVIGAGLPEWVGWIIVAALTSFMIAIILLAVTGLREYRRGKRHTNIPEDK